MSPPSNHAARHVLCIGPQFLFEAVAETVSLLGLTPDYSQSFHDAKNELTLREYEAVIMGLEGGNEQDRLLDDSSAVAVHRDGGGKRYTSHFLEYCVRKYPSMIRIVWSELTLENSLARTACFCCGTDAIVTSSEDLFETLFAIMTPNQEQIPLDKRDVLTQYGPVYRRALREEQLIQISGGSTTKRVERLIHRTERLEEDVLAMPRWVVQERLPMMMNSSTTHYTGAGENKSMNWSALTAGDDNSHRSRNIDGNIRIVHLSDTISQHRAMTKNIPNGDLFIHSGNFTCDCPEFGLDQFQDFLNWLEEEIVPKFEQVVFIAGRNELFLDKLNSPDSAHCLQARRRLSSFLRKNRSVAYLENDYIVYRGYRIHGSPSVFLRSKTQESHKRTPLSPADNKLGAFERYSDPPDDQLCHHADILVSNRPIPEDTVDYELPITPCLMESSIRSEREVKKKRKPTGRRRRLNLIARLSRQQTPMSSEREDEPPTHRAPILHAFGYDGKSFGLSIDDYDLISSNAAQQRNLRYDRYCGGTPLVIDISKQDG